MTARGPVGIGTATVRHAVRTVLDGEAAGPAVVSVTFLSAPRMRALHRRAFGADRTTDVIAFPLPHPGLVAGDVYVCPDAARQAARELGVGARQELVRLIVHGVLHVLGHRHPERGARTRSVMWRRQERYVHAVLRGRRGDA